MGSFSAFGIKGRESRPPTHLYLDTDCAYALDSSKLYGPNGEDLVWQALRNDAQLGNPAALFSIFLRNRCLTRLLLQSLHESPCWLASCTPPFFHTALWSGR